jgi:hypothetical protein
MPPTLKPEAKEELWWMYDLERRLGKDHVEALCRMAGGLGCCTPEEIAGMLFKAETARSCK